MHSTLETGRSRILTGKASGWIHRTHTVWVLVPKAPQKKPSDLMIRNRIITLTFPLNDSKVNLYLPAKSSRVNPCEKCNPVPGKQAHPSMSN